jgi:hypothetical protein
VGPLERGRRREKKERIIKELHLTTAKIIQKYYQQFIVIMLTTLPSASLKRCLHSKQI